MSTPTGLRALELKARYEAAVGNDDVQSQLLNELKSLASSSPDTATAQLAAAQVCLAAGEANAAYAFVTAVAATPELLACKIQLLLQIDRVDLAVQELAVLQRVASEESVLAELCAVSIGLTTGSSMAGDAEHTLNALAEQYGPSIYLLNLLAVALAVQGDYAAAETKLTECLRDFPVQPGAVPPNGHEETYMNLVSVLTQQHKTAEAAAMVQQLVSSTPSAFATNLGKITAAFDREAIKYKV